MLATAAGTSPGAITMDSKDISYVEAVVKAIEQGVLTIEEHITMDSGYVYVNVSGQYAYYGHSQGHAGSLRPYLGPTDDPNAATFSKNPHPNLRSRELGKMVTMLQNEGFSPIKFERTTSLRVSSDV